MKKIIPTVFLYFLLTQAFAQAQKRVSTYLWLQYNETLYDNTMVNNSRGFGLGLQAFLNNQTKFKPTLELTAE